MRAHTRSLARPSACSSGTASPEGGVIGVRHTGVLRVVAALTAGFVMAAGGPSPATAAVDAPLVDEPTTGNQHVAGSAAANDPTSPACVLRPYTRCPDADLSRHDLAGRNATGANLTRAVLDHADLTGSTLVRGDLASASLLGTRLVRATLDRADLSAAVVRRAPATAMSAIRADLSWATLSESNLTRANLSRSDLSSVLANDVILVRARLAGANLSNADLPGADLRGADFTGARMRGVSLLGATLNKATTFTRANLSGATWIDGRECARGSVGRCERRARQADEPEGGSPTGAATSVMSAISSALKIGQFIADCARSFDGTGNCWHAADPTAARFTELRNQVAALQATIDANFASTMQSLNAIIVSIKDEARMARYVAIRDDLQAAKLASQKLQEFTTCLGALNAPAPEPGGEKRCLLTGINGTQPEPYRLRTVADLMAGADGPLTESMAFAGPAARLFYATLWRFGGEDRYRPTRLNDVGVRLEDGIAGTLPGGRDGLLFSNVDWASAELMRTQEGQAGHQPVFLPGTYLLQLNRLTSYYVDMQQAYFVAVIGALRARSETTNPDARMEANVTTELYRLADNGTSPNPRGALQAQLDRFTVPLAGYSIDVDDTTPVDQQSNRPERVALFLGSSGRIYRVQQRPVEKVSPVRPPPLPQPELVPSFNDLAMLQSTVQRSGVKMSTLGRLYPYTIPRGPRAAWWGAAGTQTSRAFVGNPYHPLRPENARWSMVYATNVGPSYPAMRDAMGDRDGPSPCLTPVRMWDSRPSARDSFLEDIGPNGTMGNLTDQQFVFQSGARAAEVNGESSYDAIVRTGAVPAFGLVQPVNLRGDVDGTGVLWRCNGKGEGLAVKVAPALVLVKPVEPQGLMKLLVAGSGRESS